MTPSIYNKGVTVEKEGRRRFAVWSKGNRWGHFLLRRDAEAFAEDVRYGRAFFSEAGARLIQPKGQNELDLLVADWLLGEERDEARAKLAEVRALAESWRYKGAYGGDPRLEDGPDEEGQVLDGASAELLDILDAPSAAGVSREATP